MSEVDPLLAGVLSSLFPSVRRKVQSLVDAETALAKIRALSRDDAQANAYLEATVQLAMVGIRPKRLTQMARFFATRDPKDMPDA